MTQHALTIGVVGLGFGRAHIPAFQANGCRVVAVCQRDVVGAKAVADRYGVPHVFERWEEMLERAKPELVVIATLPHLHRAIAVRALASGAHVLCEKPLAMTRAEAEAMMDAARRAGRVGMTCFNWRFAAAMQELHSRVTEGALGRVFHLALRWFGSRWADEKAAATWRMDRAQAGHGAMGDMGVHLVDLVRWTFGEFRRVSAHTGIAYPSRSAPGRRGLLHRARRAGLRRAGDADREPRRARGERTHARGVRDARCNELSPGSRQRALVGGRATPDLRRRPRARGAPHRSPAAGGRQRPARRHGPGPDRAARRGSAGGNPDRDDAVAVVRGRVARTGSSRRDSRVRGAGRLGRGPAVMSRLSSRVSPEFQRYNPTSQPARPPASTTTTGGSQRAARTTVAAVARAVVTQSCTAARASVYTPAAMRPMPTGASARSAASAHGRPRSRSHRRATTAASNEVGRNMATPATRAPTKPWAR